MSWLVPLPTAIAVACCSLAFVVNIAFVLAIAAACCYAVDLSLRPGLVHLQLPWAVDLALLALAACDCFSPVCCFASILTIALVLNYCPGLLLCLEFL